MNVYVLLDSDNTAVLSICSSYQGGYTEVTLKESTVDLSRLAGYKVVDNYLEFDEDKYNDYILEQTKKQAIASGETMMNELARVSVLNNATDEQAYTMRYFYDEWDYNKEKYYKDERFMYNDKFYKVLQEHEPQADWTPNTASSLYVEIPDPNVEYPDFKQPQGSQDAYQTGDKITFEGKKYISLINDNVWSPTDYPSGWQLVEESEETEE